MSGTACTSGRTGSPVFRMLPGPTTVRRKFRSDSNPNPSEMRPGSIIVLHDYGTRGERTLLALSTILPELRDRGWHIVTLSELVDGDATTGHTP